MRSSEPAVAGAPAVTLEADAPLRIDCYVRRTVPPAVTDSINDVLERVRRLDRRGVVDDHRVTRWPADAPEIDLGDDGERPDRATLVAEFERWADRHGYSLEPAFQRREIPSSPFDVGPDEPRERLRVPLVTLAVRERPDDNSERATGVVPYTHGDHTYTVDEWLSVVESDGPDCASPTVQPPRLESRQ